VLICKGGRAADLLLRDEVHGMGSLRTREGLAAPVACCCCLRPAARERRGAAALVVGRPGEEEQGGSGGDRSGCARSGCGDAPALLWMEECGNGVGRWRCGCVS